MIKVSAIVLTFNEENYIRDCLESLRWCKEIWIVDSGSIDKTLDICREFTENIVYHPFKNYSTQRQWAVNLPIKTDWILFIDSDERVPPALAQEINHRLAEDQGRIAGYYISRKQYYWGKCLMHGEPWPNYRMLLFQKDRIRFSGREVHEHASVDGPTGFIKSPSIHIAFDNIAEIVEKLNKYATLDAIRMFRTGQELYAVESGSYSRLNTLLKRIFAWLPHKPFFIFVYYYFFRRGFLDGREGFAWTLMQGFYVWLSYFKLWELKQGITHLPDEEADD